MIFVKHFNVEEQTLNGLGRFYVHKHMKISDLAVMINEKMHYPVNSSLKIYEVCSVPCIVHSNLNFINHLLYFDLGNQTRND